MKNVILAVLFTALLGSCNSSPRQKSDEVAQKMTSISQDVEMDTATLAGGCFWCIEAAFEQIDGVIEAVSGYSGGTKSNADYYKVASGKTNHAEAVQVYYDANKLSYEVILDIFFTAHDPTQLNRQGPDVGPQYRTAIFYHDSNQKSIAEKKIEELSPSYDEPIVTEVNKLEAFYKAEEYHQNYQKKNPYQPYIVSISKPKAAKVRKKFPELIKKDR